MHPEDGLHRQQLEAHLLALKYSASVSCQAGYEGAFSTKQWKRQMVLAQLSSPPKLPAGHDVIPNTHVA